MSMKVLIAIDDSPYSKHIVDAVMKQHWQPGTCFKLLTVLEMLCASPEEIEEFDADKALAKIYERRWNHAQSLCEREVQKLQESFPEANVEYEIKEGSARKEIINIAVQWNAEKIYVGAHGMDVCPRNLLGSVSTYVAAHAPCSVEIIRPLVRAKEVKEPISSAHKKH